jgi:hypothetical protein
MATGSATDAEGGTITLKWEILQHHDGNHTHPWNTGTGSELQIAHDHHAGGSDHLCGNVQAAATLIRLLQAHLRERCRGHA